jgi:hypothetical protein
MDAWRRSSMGKSVRWCLYGSDRQSNTSPCSPFPRYNSLTQTTAHDPSKYSQCRIFPLQNQPQASHNVTRLSYHTCRANQTTTLMALRCPDRPF